MRQLLLICLLGTFSAVLATCPAGLSRYLRLQKPAPATPIGYGPVLSQGPICFSGAAPSAETFTVPDAKPIYSFALVYAGGAGFTSSDCNNSIVNTSSTHSGYWGCHGKGRSLFSTYITDDSPNPQFVLPRLITGSNRTSVNGTFYNTSFPHSYQFVNQSYLVNGTMLVLNPNADARVSGPGVFRLKSGGNPNGAGCTCAYVYVKQDISCCGNNGKCMYGGPDFNFCKCNKHYSGHNCSWFSSETPPSTPSTSVCHKLSFTHKLYFGHAAPNFRRQGDTDTFSFEVLSVNNQTGTMQVSVNAAPLVPGVNVTVYCTAAVQKPSGNGDTLHYYNLLFKEVAHTGIYIASSNGFYLGIGYSDNDPIYFNYEYGYAGCYVTYFEPACNKPLVGSLPSAFNQTTWYGSITEPFRRNGSVVVSLLHSPYPISPNVINGTWTARVVYNGLIYFGEVTAQFGSSSSTGRLDIFIKYPSRVSITRDIKAPFMCHYSGLGTSDARLKCTVTNLAGCNKLNLSDPLAQYWHLKQVSNTTAKNLCQPNPCQNGGICRSTYYSQVSCRCAHGFAGTFCENVVSPCPDSMNERSGHQCPSALFNETGWLVSPLFFTPGKSEPDRDEFSVFKWRTFRVSKYSAPRMEINASFLQANVTLYCNPFYYDPKGEVHYNVDLVLASGRHLYARIFGYRDSNPAISFLINPTASCERPNVQGGPNNSVTVTPSGTQWYYMQRQCPLDLNQSCTNSPHHGQWHGISYELKGPEKFAMWFFDSKLRVIVNNRTYTADTFCDPQDPRRMTAELSTRLDGFIVKFIIFSDALRLRALIVPPNECSNMSFVNATYPPSFLSLTNISNVTNVPGYQPGMEMSYLELTRSSCQNATTSPCNNNGTCITNSDGSVGCQCNANWTGETCNIPVKRCDVVAATDSCAGLGVAGLAHGVFQLNSSNFSASANAQGLPYRFIFGQQTSAGLMGEAQIAAGAFRFRMFCTPITNTFYRVDVHWNGTTNGLTTFEYAPGKISYGFASLEKKPDETSYVWFLNAPGACSLPVLTNNAITPPTAFAFVSRQICIRTVFPRSVHKQVIGSWGAATHEGPAKLTFSSDATFEYLNLQPRPDSPSVFAGTTYMNSTNATGIIAATLRIESPPEFLGFVVRALIDVNYSANNPDFAPPGVAAMVTSDLFDCAFPEAINVRTIDKSRHINDLMFMVPYGQPLPATCFDGIQNGDETGVDCGGTYCPNACPVVTKFYYDTFSLPDGPFNKSNPFNIWAIGNSSDRVNATHYLDVKDETLVAYGTSVTSGILRPPIVTNGVTATKTVSFHFWYSGNCTLAAASAFQDDPFRSGDASQWIGGVIADGRFNTSVGTGSGRKAYAIITSPERNITYISNHSYTLYPMNRYTLRVIFNMTYMNVSLFKSNRLVLNMSHSIVTDVREFTRFGFYLHSDNCSKSSRTQMDDFLIESTDLPRCPVLQTSCPSAWQDTQWWGGELNSTNLTQPVGAEGLSTRLRFHILTFGRMPTQLNSSNFTVYRANSTCQKLFDRYYNIDVQEKPTVTYRGLAVEETDEELRENLILFVNTDGGCVRSYWSQEQNMTGPVILPTVSSKVFPTSKRSFLQLPNPKCPSFFPGFYSFISSGDKPDSKPRFGNITITYMGLNNPMRFNFTQTSGNGGLESFAGVVHCEQNVTSTSNPFLTTFSVEKPASFSGFSVQIYFNFNASYLPAGHIDAYISDKSTPLNVTFGPIWGPVPAKGITEVLHMAPNGTNLTDCRDGIKNGNEQGVDCGGSFCTPCLDTVFQIYNNFSTLQNGQTLPFPWWHDFNDSETRGGAVNNSQLCTTNYSAGNIIAPAIVADEIHVQYSYRTVFNVTHIFTGAVALVRPPEVEFNKTNNNSNPLVYISGCLPYFYPKHCWVANLINIRDYEAASEKMKNMTFSSTTEAIHFLQSSVPGLSDAIPFADGAWYNFSASYNRFTSTASLRIEQYGRTIVSKKRSVQANLNLTHPGFYMQGSNYSVSCSNHVRIIAQSTNVTGCARKPCQNGGLCVDTSNDNFSCTCQPTFFGRLCERQCSHGEFRNASNFCERCPPGRFSSGLSQSVCFNCSQNTFQARAGRSSCDNCQAGTYTPSHGFSTCLNCPAGTSSEIGTGCTRCPLGSVSNAGGVCKDCPAEGWSNAVGSKLLSNTTCTKCPVGTYKKGRGACQLCSPGRFSAITGGSACTDCAAGYFQGAPGASVCFQCSPGKVSVQGATTCTQCSAGTFRSSNCPGTLTVCCENCPQNYTSPAGSSSKSACEAVPQAPNTCPTPVIVNVTDTVLFLKLKDPSYTGTSAIDSFVVVRQNGSTFVPIRYFGSGVHAMPGLSASTTYNISCVAINKDGLRSPQSSSVSVTTLSAAPHVVSVVASDPDNGDAVWSNGDRVVITFDVATNQPAASSTADLNKLFMFSTALGSSLSGAWSSPSVLTITINDIGSGSAPVLGLDGLKVKASGNLQSKDGSAPSTSGGVLSGTWGTSSTSRLITFVVTPPLTIQENSSFPMSKFVAASFGSATAMRVTFTVKGVNSANFLSVGGGQSTHTVTVYISPNNVTTVFESVVVKPGELFFGTFAIAIQATSGQQTFAIDGSVKVTPVNNPPVLTVPASITAPIASWHTLTGFDVADPDASSTEHIEVLFNAGLGGVMRTTTTVAGVVVFPAGGVTSATVYMQGSLAGINSIIDGLQVKYIPILQAQQRIQVFAQDANNGFAQAVTNVTVSCTTAAPTPSSVTMSPRLDSLNVTFTGRVEFCSGVLVPCSSVVHADTLPKLGLAPHCQWISRTVLRIGLGAYLGSTSPPRPGTDMFKVKAGAARGCCGGSSNAETTLPIQLPSATAPTVSIFGPTEFTSGCKGMKLLLISDAVNTGPYGAPVIYDWKPLDSKFSAQAQASIVTDKPFLQVDSELLEAGGTSSSYTFSLTVTNFVNVKSTVATHVVKALPQSAPVIRAITSRLVVVKRSHPFVVLGAVGSTSSCGQIVALTYSWSSSSSSVPTTSTSPRQVLITKNLPTGVTTFTVTVCTPSQSCSSLAFTVTVLESPPVAVLDSGSSMVSYTASAFSLSAAKSFDPDNSGTTLTFAWTCVTLNDVPCTNALTSQPFSFGTANSITVPANSLVAGTYILKVQVSKGSLSSFDSVVVEMVNVPTIAPRLIPLAAETAGGVVSSSSYGLLRTAVNYVGAIASIKYSLVAGKSSAALVADLAAAENRYYLYLNGQFLDNYFNPGDTYTLQVEVTAVDKNVLPGKASFTFKINSPPVGCGLSAPSSTALTAVTITASGCTDPDGSTDLTYVFFYKSPSTGRKVYLSERPSAVPYIETKELPPGDANNGNQLVIGVEALDALDSSSFTASVVVNPFTTTKTLASLFSDVVQSSQSAQSWGDVINAISLFEESAKSSQLSGTELETLVSTMVTAVTSVVNSGDSSQGTSIARKLASLTNSTGAITTTEATAVVDALKKMFANGIITDGAKSAVEFLLDALTTLVNLLTAVASSSVSDGEAPTLMGMSFERPAIWRDMAVGDATHRATTDNIYVNIQNSVNFISGNVLVSAGDTRTIELSGLAVTSVRQLASTGHTITLNAQANPATITVPAAALSGKVSGATPVDVAGAYAVQNSYYAWPVSGKTAAASPSVSLYMSDVTTSSSPVAITANANQVALTMKVNCTSATGCKNFTCYKWDTSSGAFVTTGVATGNVPTVTSGPSNGLSVTCHPTESGTYAAFAEHTSDPNQSGGGSDDSKLPLIGAAVGVVVVLIVIGVLFVKKRRSSYGKQSSMDNISQLPAAGEALPARIELQYPTGSSPPPAYAGRSPEGIHGGGTTSEGFPTA